MPEHNFTLILTGDIDAHIDELHEDGCDDALFGEIDGTTYAEFDREAATFLEAVLSAVADVERVDGLRVTRVEPDDLVTASDIAERLGRSRESVRLLVAGARGPGDFPASISHTRQRNRLWRWSDVLAWHDPDAPDLGDARAIALLNTSLQLRDNIVEHVANRQEDKDFQARIARMLDENRELLNRLAQ